ncbi:MAG TPA: RecX family transcriptional regulator [Armatimonadota bacterium]|nr:RecX family transcriptional regulator [Armatimonadota bacterium]
MSTKNIPDEDRAMQYAFRVLGYRQRSEVEMRQRLERKGFSAQVTDHTLAELSRLALLDDREFVRGWIASHTDRGPARLKQELRQKGIDRSLAEEMITTGISVEKELASAWQTATRAVRNRELPLERAEMLRVRRLLLRKGFSYDVINQVCARLNSHLTAEGDWLE